MAINISVQYNGGASPRHYTVDPRLLPWLCLYSLCNRVFLLPCLMMYYIVFVFAAFLVSLHGD